MSFHAGSRMYRLQTSRSTVCDIPAVFNASASTNACQETSALLHDRLCELEEGRTFSSLENGGAGMFAIGQVFVHMRMDRHQWSSEVSDGPASWRDWCSLGRRDRSSISRQWCKGDRLDLAGVTKGIQGVLYSWQIVLKRRKIHQTQSGCTSKRATKSCGAKDRGQADLV